MFQGYPKMSFWTPSQREGRNLKEGRNNPPTLRCFASLQHDSSTDTSVLEYSSSYVIPGTFRSYEDVITLSYGNSLKGL
jgi:hypothetical protein